jgi:hypothetical protein
VNADRPGLKPGNSYSYRPNNQNGIVNIPVDGFDVESATSKDSGVHSGASVVRRFDPYWRSLRQFDHGFPNRRQSRLHVGPPNNIEPGRIALAIGFKVLAKPIREYEISPGDSFAQGNLDDNPSSFDHDDSFFVHIDC